MKDQEKEALKPVFVNSAAEFARETGINLGAIQKDLDELAKKVGEQAAAEEE